MKHAICLAIACGLAACTGTSDLNGTGASTADVAAASCANAPPWTPNHAYAVGDDVTYGGAVYACVLAHMSLTGWEPSVTPALWQPTTCASSPSAPHDAGSTPHDAGASDAGASSAHAECAKLFGGGAKSKWVTANPDGSLAYATLPKGERIVDFSSAGYGGGGVAIPNAPAFKTLSPSGGDDTAAIQAALDAAAKAPLVSGVRGAVVLAAGSFQLTGSLSIGASGVVLRGAGSASGGTTITLTGSPRLFIDIGGNGGWSRSGSAASITDAYVPSGASTVHVADASAFAVGNTVLVDRPVTAAWVHFMGMDTLTRNGSPQTWISPGAVIHADRTIAAIHGNALTLDAPITDSYDAQYTTPTIGKYSFNGRIANVGVEHLRVVAPALSTPISQASFTFLSANAIIDSWVRDVVFQDFVNGVQIGSTAKRMTIEDMQCVHTVGETSPQPADFAVGGQQILMQRLTSGGTNVHFLVTQNQTPGPNVFLDVSATGSKGDDSAPHQRWATGVLFDRVSTPGAGIELQNRGNYGSGHGWAAGFSVLWNCTASHILVQQPPGAQNWSVGCKGTEATAAPPGSTTVEPQGAVDSPGAAVAPSSLYLSQLCDRLGPQAVKNAGYTLP